jgi:hypothetical protein
MNALRALVQRIQDDRITQSTLRAIDDRECVHDGSDPMCERGATFYNGA